MKTSKELKKIMRSCFANENELAEKEFQTSRGQTSDNSNGRHKWTSAEIAELETAFSSNIESHSISMDRVRKTVKMFLLTYFGENSGEISELSVLQAGKESLENHLRRAGLDKPINDEGNYTKANSLIVALCFEPGSNLVLLVVGF